jgi:hypothetical protein
MYGFVALVVVFVACVVGACVACAGIGAASRDAAIAAPSNRNAVLPGCLIATPSQ